MFDSNLKKNQKPSLKLLLVAIFVCFGGSFHFACQFSVTNPLQEILIGFTNKSLNSHYNLELTKQNLEVIWSAIVAILYIGAITGAIVLPKITQRLGFVKGHFLAFFTSFLSCILSIISYFINRIELFIIARLLFGFSFGIGLTLNTLYLSDCSPKQCRGTVSMIIGLMIQTGSIVGSVLGLPNLFGTTSHWWIIYLIESFVIFFVMIFLPFLHESPSHSLLLNKVDEAKLTIQFFHDSRDENYIDSILQELHNNLKLKDKAISVLNICGSSKYNCRATLIGCVIAIASIFSGVSAICSYAVEILKSTGVSSHMAAYGNVVLASLGLFFCTFSIYIIDKFGRRQLLLTTYCCIIILNSIIFVLMRLYEQTKSGWLGYCLLATFCLFFFFFIIGPGPISFFVTAEMFSSTARSAGQSWTNIIQMICRGLVILFFLPLKQVLDMSLCYLFLFVIPLIFTTSVLFFYLPETKGRNFSEVLLEVEKLPKIKNYIKKISTKKISIIKSDV